MLRHPQAFVFDILFHIALLLLLPDIAFAIIIDAAMML